MNELLKDLEKRSVFFNEEDSVFEFDREKFAELIVKECISALEEKIYRSIDHEGDEIWIDLILKEHFGVEE